VATWTASELWSVAIKTLAPNAFVVRALMQLAKYIAHKGSICIDGTSLTVNQVEGS
jgi:riboflavin synthase alpha subunit